MAFVPPPGYQPIYNPTLPYSGPIYGGLRKGMSIYVQGHVPHHAMKFTVNLACGQYQGADVALHVNPRYEGKDRVIFNTFQGNSWGCEEKKKDMPFKKGHNFEMVIHVRDDIYEVFVNGSRFYGYKHRIPVERVDSVFIDGTVNIQSINIMGGVGGGIGGPAAMPIPSYPGAMPPAMPTPSYPGGFPPAMPTPSYPGGNPMPIPGYPAGNLPGMGGAVVYNPTIPYVAKIPGGMSAKKTIIVRGNVPYGANSFHINFKVGYSNDIALHFNPRMNENALVRNSMIHGSWGHEERAVSYNPFQHGQFFDLSIRCGNGRFKVFVNGQHVFDYNHRLHNLQQIDTLEIGGSVSISYVQL